MRWISAIAVSSIAVACCNAQQSVRRDPDRIWTFLAKRHDKNADGSIDLQEYGRGKERFASLDHDGDGVLTRADFERSVRGQRAPGRRVLSPGQRVGRDMADAGIDMQAVMVALARDADEDSDDRVTKGEWERFCKAQLEGDAFVVRRFQGRRAAPMVLSLILARLDTDASALVSYDEALALFSDLDTDTNGVLELQELVAKPARPAALYRGLVAPDFDLPYVGKVKLETAAGDTVRLSSFRGKRPVALIFGSYT